jgi:hypothetical protein
MEPVLLVRGVHGINVGPLTSEGLIKAIQDDLVEIFPGCQPAGS